MNIQMKISNNIIYLFLVIIFSSSAYSQNWLKVDSVFAVSGVTVKNFSAPFFADIDNDGDIDLFLGNITDVTDFFRNNGSNFPATFTKDTSLLWSIYSGGLQNTNSDYPVLADLDNDGDFDLVIGGYYGLLYYENTGTNTDPEFVKNDSVFINVNLLIGGDPKPAFADLDDDGDLDLLVGIGESLQPGPEPGLTLGFRNTGSASEPEFLPDSSLAAGIPDVGLNSYPALADLDGDGDFDLLIGRDGSLLFYYENTGSKSVPAWTRQHTTFSPVETTTYWKNPTFADLDYDGDYDLIYGTSNGDLYVYRNTGSTVNPVFQIYNDYFKIIKASGNGATVSLADFDGDGDYDLLSGVWTGRFEYFRNDGNNQTPVFNPVNMSFSTISVGSYSSPVFIDIDNDGDYDIVSGALNGQVYCYINNNGSFTQNTTMFDFIDVGFFSIPVFADLDGDGYPDLLVGAEDGSSCRFYLNDGNNVFEENTTFFADINFPNYSRPSLADIDNDGDFDLIIGRSNGALYYYRNDGNSELPVWVRDDSVFDGVKVKQNAHPGFADLDGDGRKDLIIGEYDGNFTYFKNLFAPASVDDLENLITGFELYQNYPNPFNPATTIKYRVTQSSKVNISVYDLLGSIITVLVDEYKSPGIYEVKFNGENISSGIYFYTMKAMDRVISRKLILLK
jgi:hypothetical protein